MIARFDDKIDAPNAGCGRRPWPTRMSCGPGRFPASGRSTAAAFKAYAPDMAEFEQGRDFAAWAGLAPGRHSTGGKMRMGRAGKMGESIMRRLLVSGAMAAYPPRRGRGSTRTAGSRACWRGCREKRPR